LQCFSPDKGNPALGPASLWL